jgi:predicted DNA-binding protein YlxM (UPF0122 family)
VNPKKPYSFGVKSLVNIPKMIDPVTALGLVSFGIQVLQSVSGYYGDVVSRDTDIAQLVNSAEGLVVMLELIQKLVEDKAYPEEQTTAVFDNIWSCKEHIDKLERKLNKVHNSGPRTVQDKVVDFAKRISYPFKKKTILAIQDTINALSQNVSLGMQGLLLYASDEQRKELLKHTGVLISMDDNMRTMLEKFSIAEEDLRYLRNAHEGKGPTMPF